jgi:hypothetical protein
MAGKMEKARMLRVEQLLKNPGHMNTSDKGQGTLHFQVLPCVEVSGKMRDGRKKDTSLLSRAGNIYLLPLLV